MPIVTRPALESNIKRANVCRGACSAVRPESPVEQNTQPQKAALRFEDANFLPRASRSRQTHCACMRPGTRKEEREQSTARLSWGAGAGQPRRDRREMRYGTLETLQIELNARLVANHAELMRRTIDVRILLSFVALIQSQLVAKAQTAGGPRVSPPEEHC
ncbi:hypothetical protein U1Q18_044787 [Sarracenia purpurea var. burkii]